MGTAVTYVVGDADGVPTLRRTSHVLGDANEGDVKVSNVRLHLGTRPILAAGNSAGDARMLDYVLGADRDGVALLVNHDDSEREYCYESVAGTFDAAPLLRRPLAASGSWPACATTGRCLLGAALTRRSVGPRRTSVVSRTDAWPDSVSSLVASMAASVSHRA